MAVAVTMSDGVAVIAFSHPPVNALSVGAGLPQEITRALDAAEADPAVRAVVLRGEGRGFSAGADVSDMTGDAARDVAPGRALIDRLDAMGKPVVAALHGMALGGGLEVAMAAHWRVCAGSTRLGLPEVTLGLLPGGGGTQRLPRLVGMRAALSMIAEGRQVGAEEALGLGLVDDVVPAPDLLDAAVTRARAAPARRTRDLPVRDDAGPEEFAHARQAAGKRRATARAVLAAIDCVQAARGDFAAGVAMESRAFDALLASDESRGLRHAFLSERAVSRIPGLAHPREPGLAAHPRENAIVRAAVIGAGTMGTGIALALLNAGLDVALVEPRADALSRSLATIRATLDKDAGRGRIDAATAAARMAALAPAAEYEAARDADIVIEAVFEDMQVKHAVFAELDRVARPDAILASNTSTLDIDAIAAATERPERVLGTHFFSPANVMRLLEIVRGERTAPEILADVLALAKRIGKVGVVSGVCDGFIGNRMLEEYLRQAYLLLEEGATPAQVDGALERWGMAMGPLRMMDLAGGDVGWSIRKRRAAEQPDRPYSRIPDLVCELGRFGQKTGAGFYRYPDGARTPVPDPEIDALIAGHSREIGVQRRAIADEEIVARCLLALANEGARVLEDGIAARPLDIDQVYLHGYGFPAQRGGPMFYADMLGLPSVLEAIRAFGRGREGWAWAPAPLLQDLVARGADFASLNREDA